MQPLRLVSVLEELAGPYWQLLRVSKREEHYHTMAETVVAITAYNGAQEDSTCLGAMPTHPATPATHQG